MKDLFTNIPPFRDCHCQPHLTIDKVHQTDNAQIIDRHSPFSDRNRHKRAQNKQ